MTFVCAILFWFVAVSFNFGIGVKINKLQVPEIIKHGDTVILDCDFTLDATEKDLVVKWYFSRNNQSLVYQWIPGSKNRPRALGILKDRLNLEYTPSYDANSRHRALYIKRAGADLSGEYTCKVSTMQSEDARTKSMLVFVPVDHLNLRRLSSEEGLIRVQCSAEGVFPRPDMTLHSQKRKIEDADVSLKQRGQLYEISVTTTMKELEVPEEFLCELRIPQANYSVRDANVFYPGNKAWLIRSEARLTLASWIFALYFAIRTTFYADSWPSR